MKTDGNVEVLARGLCVVDNAILVCHTKGSEVTYLPGGHVEFLETVPVALAREIEEELGRKSEVGRFLGVVEHSFLQKGEMHHEMNLCFMMDVEGVAPKANPPSEEDYIEFKWIQLDELEQSNLEPAPLRNILPGWLQGGGETWASTIDA